MTRKAEGRASRIPNAKVPARSPQRPRRSRHALEAEAEVAMTHAVRGARHDARDLSPTAAGRALGGSGQPLPAEVRTRLERTFAADLSAVRVHEGPAAARAARDARALASGAHVYLGTGECATSPRSFPVLAHEVAHVLQQTGRETADGRTAAAERTGSAEPYSFTWKAPFVSSPVTFTETKLFAAWRGAATLRGDTASVDQINALETSRNAAASGTVFWSDRAAAVVGDKADPALAVGGGPDPKLADLAPLARSALYDGLKLNGQLAAAVKILTAFDTVESGVLVAGVYEAFVDSVGIDHVLDRIGQLWVSLPLLDQARPNKALALTFAYLMGTFSSVPETPIHETGPMKPAFLARDIDALVKAARTSGSFEPNELVTAALIAIAQLEHYRIDLLKPPADGSRIHLTHDAQLDERVTIADRVVQWSKQVAKQADSIRAGTENAFRGVAETRHLLVRDWAPALGALAAFALDTWHLGDLAGAAARDPGNKEAAARHVDPSTLSGIGTTKPEPFPGLAAELVAHANATFARNADGSLPSPAKYAGTLQVGIATIGARLLAIQSAVVAQVNRAWNVSGKPLSFDASLVPAERKAMLAQATWLIAILAGHRQTLRSYSAAADNDFKKAWTAKLGRLKPPITSWPGADVRIMHRAKVAAGLVEIADMASLSELAGVARPINAAEETLPGGGKQQDDVLALVDGWRPQPDAQIAKLADDMQGSPIQQLEQISVEQLVLFFQGDRYRRLSDRIDALLGGPEGSRFEIDQVPIINQARTAENASDFQPLRHRIPKGSFIYLHRDPSGPAVKTGTSRSLLWSLISQHPITQFTVLGWPNWLVPVNQGAPDLVLWKIPDLSRMASRLRAIPAVNTLLARYAQVDPLLDPVPTLAKIKALSDEDWWKLWERLTKADAAALEKKRSGELQQIPEVNARLAEFAAIEVQPPEPVPKAADLAAADIATWMKWFTRLAWNVNDELWTARNTRFRKVPAIDAAVARYLAEDLGAGANAPTAVDLANMSDGDWLERWRDVIAVAFARRAELGDAIGAAGFAASLRSEKEKDWGRLKDRQRAAFVHERERIIRTRVLPLLDAYDPTANAWEKTTVNKNTVLKRNATEDALDTLTARLFYQIDDKVERAAHQAAAFLRIAPVLRDKLVALDDGKWVMRGWDLGVALTWFNIIGDTLTYLSQNTALDPWLRADEQPAATWIASRQPDLQHVYDGLLAALVSHQEEFGIDAYGGDGTIENPGKVTELDSSREFGPSHSFTIDGVTWEVLTVYRSFRYHPAILRNDGKLVKGSVLKIDGTPTDYDGKPLLKVARDGQTLDINWSQGDDLYSLRPFAYAVMMASTVEQLLELGQALETGAMFAMGVALDILDMIPLEGQAAEVARVIGMVKFVLGASQWAELAKSLVEDPAKVIDQAWDRIKSLFSVEGLLETVLLAPSLDFLTTIVSLIPAHRNTGSTNSRIGKVLRRLEKLARSIGGAIGRVVQIGHIVRDDIEGFVLEHPLLARILDLVADHIRLVDEIPTLTAGWDQLETSIFDLVKKSFMGIVDSIGQLRFPAQVITMGDLVSFTLDLVARALGGKYALGYEIVKQFLIAVDEWDNITDFIGDQLKKVLGFDPAEAFNSFLHFIDDLLKPLIEAGQKEVHGVLKWIYEAIPGRPSGDQFPELGPLSIKKEGDQFLDTAAMPREGASAATRPLGVELSGGRPLSPGQRRRFEGQFGQDLSHVRLHTGVDAMRATRAAGARALTTGSHVLIAPDVDPNADSGQRVMRHEFVHVLQQTGPRGTGSTDRPEIGEPGKGVRFDPAAESAARQISTMSGAASVSPGAVRGLQPDYLSFGQRFVDYLTHVERAKPEIARIEKTKSGTGGVLIGKEVREHVAHVGDGIKKWIAGFGVNSVAKTSQGTFGPVADKIKAWLVHNETIIADAIEDVAVATSDTEKRRDDANESAVNHLKVGAFRLKLIDFIAGATGVDVAIDLKTEPSGQLHKEDPIKSIEMRAFDLAIVPDDGPGKVLWDELMKNSFGGSTDVNLRAHARILLFAVGFADKVWDDSKFALTTKLRDQIVREGALTAGIKLEPADYFWHGTKRPTDTSKPALWIGKHGDATHHGMPDRQSHHTTQFLLVQYFEMGHSLRPFPEPKTNVRDTLDKDLQIKFTKHVDAVDNIAVGTLDPSTGHRGENMPALLVSAVMHRRGLLHVVPPKEDDREEDDIPVTQGGTVHRWFRSALSDAIGEDTANAYWDAVQAIKDSPPPAASGLATPQPKTAPVDWLKVNAPKLAPGLTSAMRATYAQMKRVMQPPILLALQTLEKTWYEQLAVARKESITSGPYQVTDSHISAVNHAALDNNDRIMEGQSHWR